MADEDHHTAASLIWTTEAFEKKTGLTLSDDELRTVQDDLQGKEVWNLTVNIIQMMKKKEKKKEE